METSSNGKHDVAGIIAELDERGYCVIPDVISTEKADQARTVLERLLAEEATEGTWRTRTQRVAPHCSKGPDLRGTDGPSPCPHDLETVPR